jgi:hypothetical protein
LLARLERIGYRVEALKRQHERRKTYWPQIAFLEQIKERAKGGPFKFKRH